MLGLMAYFTYLYLNGVLLGVKSPTDPITFDPNYVGHPGWWFDSYFVPILSEKDTI